jgi:ribonuclease HII
MILGIDEAGRGPWAGPLAVGAVVLGGAEIDGLTDSKRLTKKRRESLDLVIREQAGAFAVGFAEAIEIDELGLSAALRLATIRAAEQIKIPYHEIIIDGTVNFLKDTNKGSYVTTIAKADLLVPAVSAASIIAKVARDNIMAKYDAVYPGYGFATHSGYGTALHRAAIDAHGVTPIHRLSFAPLAKYAALNHETKDGVSASRSLSTKAIGDAAETEVANFLARKGHEILDRNWKTRFCEIDIVSKKDDTIYFTEVKYRKQAHHGDGFAAITPKKLRQMKFAAEYYSVKNNLERFNLLLTAASLEGNPATVVDFLEFR